MTDLTIESALELPEGIVNTNPNHLEAIRTVWGEAVKVKARDMSHSYRPSYGSMPKRKLKRERMVDYAKSEEAARMLWLMSGMRHSPHFWVSALAEAGMRYMKAKGDFHLTDLGEGE